MTTNNHARTSSPGRTHARQLARELLALIANDLIHHRAIRPHRAYALRLLVAERLAFPPLPERASYLDPENPEAVARALLRVHKLFSRPESAATLLTLVRAASSKAVAAEVDMLLAGGGMLRGSLPGDTPWHDEPVKCNMFAFFVPAALPEKAPVPVVLAGADPELPDDGLPLGEWLDHLERRSQMEATEFPVDRRVSVWLPADDLPVAVTFSSDWHLGSVGCDYAGFRRDFEFLLRHHEALKLITVGDLMDNFAQFKSAEAMAQQIANPRLQLRLMEKAADELAATRQYLAACWGNHDNERDEHSIGSSPLATLLARHTHYFDAKGVLTLKVGPSEEESAEYTIVLTHKPPSKSMWDKTMGAKKLYHAVFPADIVVTAHHHAPAYTTDSHYEEARAMGFPFGGTRAFIATGTYKIDDLYSRRGFAEGRIGAPTVLFWPRQRRIEICKSAENALIMRHGLSTFRG